MAPAIIVATSSGVTAGVVGVATMIAGAIAEFKHDFTSAVGSSTKELVQSQLAEFQSQIKQEFQANLAEAMKRQQVQITAASPCVTTPTTPRPGTGSKGFSPPLRLPKRRSATPGCF